MENRIVKVKNMGNSRVGIFNKEDGIVQTWERKGAIKPVMFDKLMLAIYDPGVEYLFKSGILYIESMQDKIDLGLEEAGTDKPTKIISLTDEEKERYLTVMPLFEFKKKVKDLPLEQVHAIVDYAIANKKMDVEKDKVLQQLTEIDIISAIKLNEADKEE